MKALVYIARELPTRFKGRLHCDVCDRIATRAVDMPGGRWTFYLCGDNRHLTKSPVELLKLFDVKYGIVRDEDWQAWIEARVKGTSHGQSAGAPHHQRSAHRER